MGYNTDFAGAFKLDLPLTDAERTYLTAFAASRRVARRAMVAERMPDPIRDAVCLPIGAEGCYFVGEDRSNLSVIDYNKPPRGQPGLWCDWQPDETGRYIRWNERETFYRYVEWLKYLIEHFILRWGRTLNGVVRWSGEEPHDLGCIVVKDNAVFDQPAKIEYAAEPTHVDVGRQ